MDYQKRADKVAVGPLHQFSSKDPLVSSKDPLVHGNVFASDSFFIRTKHTHVLFLFDGVESTKHFAACRSIPHRSTRTRTRQDDVK